MTSTNDGKDVKSNQTSGQKGKTYYIELYKSLEARLSGECSGEERTRHVCEAWRRVHCLCLHSAPSTHPHLLSWLQRHTSHTILQTEWQSPKSKEQHTWLEEAINAFIGECKDALSKRGGVSQPWEIQLLQRARWFLTVLPNPWGHPVLKALLDSRGPKPSDGEVLQWLKEERGVMFVTRLRQLAASRCDDLALLLASAVMNHVRFSTRVVADVDQAEEQPPDKPEATNELSFPNILRKEAGFTTDVWELLTDIEFVLLYKGESRARCIELAKLTPLRHGYKIVERLHNRLENSPHEKKLWKNAKDVATLIAQVVIARCMVVPHCTGVPRAALYGCVYSLVQLLPADKLPTAAAALAAPAATSRHLHTLAAAVHAQCKDDRKPFVCSLYVRAITAGMNELEKLKLDTEKASEARAIEQTLASWFIQLGTLLSASSRLNCECTLTAFSVHPSPTMYERVKRAPPLAPLIMPDIQEQDTETNSEYGSWATDSRTHSNLVKTSETLKLKQTQKQANVLSTAIFAEGEGLGLEADLCQDLAVLLSGPRVKTLYWDMDREVLLENCRTYMERTHGGTRALTTELKYLNLDPNCFQHLPEEEDEDENDIYYGIEKGYEHLVEFEEPEPEDVMCDGIMSDYSETTNSIASIEELPMLIPKRKKKKKKQPQIFSEEEVDPLSLVCDTFSENKDIIHSKERSKHKNKERSKSKVKIDHTKERNENNGIADEIIKDIETKVKKKQKKERKKKNKLNVCDIKIKDQNFQSSSNLSKLIGMKIARSNVSQIERRNINPNVNACTTDSDYDSQGKSSINSEYNENALNEALQSIDIKLSHKPLTDDSQRTSFPPTSYKPTTITSVKEDVKRSIQKLIEYRRHNVFNDNSINRDSSDSYTHRHSIDHDFLKNKKLSNNINSSVIDTTGVKCLDKPHAPVKNSTAVKNESSNICLTSNQGNFSSKKKTLNLSLQTTKDRQGISANEKSMKKGLPRIWKPKQTSQMKHDVNNFTETPSQKQYQEFLLQRQFIATQDPILTSESQGQMQFQEFLKKQHQQLNEPSVSTSIAQVLSKQLPSQQINRSVTPSQVQFHNFLKELQETINAGATNEMRDSKCMHTLHDKAATKKIIQTKKVDNAANTYARLSYMHKNKQCESKLKVANNLIIQNKPLVNVTVEQIGHIKDIDVEKVSYLQSKGEIVLSKVVKPKKKCPIEKPKVLVQNIENISDCSTSINNPLHKTVLSNMLPSGNNITDYTEPRKTETEVIKQCNMPTPKSSTSFLSEKDQFDLLLLLRQQSKMNPPKIPVKTEVPNTLSGILIKNSSSHCVNSEKQCLDLHDKIPVLEEAAKSTFCPTSVIKVTNNKTLNNGSETKKSRAKGSKQKIKNESDWKSVMDDLLAHKTPSMIGPNALDVVLKKDSFEKRSSECLNNPNCKSVITSCINKTKTINNENIAKHLTQDTQTASTSRDSSFNLKSAHTEDLKLEQDVVQSTNRIRSVDLAKKRPTHIQSKHFSSVIQNSYDPFISGIPNSDYDLLEELMDDDLRQEIGELSSDEETYRNPNLSTSKTKNNLYIKESNLPITKINAAAAGNPFNLSSISSSDSVKKCSTNGITIVKKDLSLKSSSLPKEIIRKNLDSNNCANLKPRIISNELITGSTLVKKSSPSGKVCNNFGTTMKAVKSNTTKLCVENAPHLNITTSKTKSQTSSKMSVNICSDSNLLKTAGNTKVLINSVPTASNVQNVLDPAQVVLTVPQRNTQQAQAQNLMLIGSNDLIYDRFTTIHQSTQSGTFSDLNKNTYVAVNQAPMNVTLLHSTPFVGPVLNPVIIESSVTLPIIQKVAPNISTNFTLLNSVNPEPSPISKNIQPLNTIKSVTIQSKTSNEGKEKLCQLDKNLEAIKLKDTTSRSTAADTEMSTSRSNCKTGDITGMTDLHNIKPSIKEGQPGTVKVLHLDTKSESKVSGDKKCPVNKRSDTNELVEKTLSLDNTSDILLDQETVKNKRLLLIEKLEKNTYYEKPISLPYVPIKSSEQEKKKQEIIDKGGNKRNLKTRRKIADKTDSCQKQSSAQMNKKVYADKAIQNPVKNSCLSKDKNVPNIQKNRKNFISNFDENNSSVKSKCGHNLNMDLKKSCNDTRGYTDKQQQFCKENIRELKENAKLLNDHVEKSNENDISLKSVKIKNFSVIKNSCQKLNIYTETNNSSELSNCGSIFKECAEEVPINKEVDISEKNNKFCTLQKLTSQQNDVSPNIIQNINTHQEVKEAKISKDSSKIQHFVNDHIETKWVDIEEQIIPVVIKSTLIKSEELSDDKISLVGDNNVTHDPKTTPIISIKKSDESGKVLLGVNNMTNDQIASPVISQNCTVKKPDELCKDFVGVNNTTHDQKASLISIKNSDESGKDLLGVNNVTHDQIASVISEKCTIKKFDELCKDKISMVDSSNKTHDLKESPLISNNWGTKTFDELCKDENSSVDDNNTTSTQKAPSINSDVLGKDKISLVADTTHTQKVCPLISENYTIEKSDKSCNDKFSLVDDNDTTQNKKQSLLISQNCTIKKADESCKDNILVVDNNTHDQTRTLLISQNSALTKSDELCKDKVPWGSGNITYNQSKKMPIAQSFTLKKSGELVDKNTLLGNHSKQPEKKASCPISQCMRLKDNDFDDKSTVQQKPTDASNVTKIGQEILDSKEIDINEEMKTSLGNHSKPHEKKVSSPISQRMRPKDTDFDNKSTVQQKPTVASNVTKIVQEILGSKELGINEEMKTSLSNHSKPHEKKVSYPISQSMRLKDNDFDNKSTMQQKPTVASNVTKIVQKILGSKELDINEEMKTSLGNHSKPPEKKVSCPISQCMRLKDNDFDNKSTMQQKPTVAKNLTKTVQEILGSKELNINEEMQRGRGNNSNSTIKTVTNTYPETVEHRKLLKDVSNTKGSLNLENDPSQSENYTLLNAKITYEELPNSCNGPQKRCVRIKLPNGNSFKATISGKSHVSLDSIFEDPTVKSLLWKNINNNTKCTLNIKQSVVSLQNKKEPPILKTVVKSICPQRPPQQIEAETINLISDDEEDTQPQSFKTEFGIFNVKSLDPNIHLKHQKKLSQKSVVVLKRNNALQEIVPDVEANIESNKPDKANIPSEKPISTPAIVTDYIEIEDDSSNDSVTLVSETNTNENNKTTLCRGKVDELKNLLLKDLGVEVNDDKTSKGVLNKTQAIVENVDRINSDNKYHIEPLNILDELTKNIDVINQSTNIQRKALNIINEINRKVEVLNKNTGILDENKNNMEADNRTESEDNLPVRQIENNSKQVRLKIKKCDDLVEQLKIKKQRCFVSLIRCDDALLDYERQIDSCTGNKETDELLHGAPCLQNEITIAAETTLKRSGSESILNALADNTVDFSLSTNYEDLSDPMSPSLIHNFDIPINLKEHILNSSDILVGLSNKICDADWFTTKSFLSKYKSLDNPYRDSIEIFKECETDEDSLTDCDSDLDVSLLKDESFQVPSLVKLIVNLLANDPHVLEKYIEKDLKSENERNMNYSPLKRKANELVEIRPQSKILKVENHLDSEIVSQSKRNCNSIRTNNTRTQTDFASKNKNSKDILECDCKIKESRNQASEVKNEIQNDIVHMQYQEVASLLQIAIKSFQIMGEIKENLTSVEDISYSSNSIVQTLSTNENEGNCFGKTSANNATVALELEVKNVHDEYILRTRETLSDGEQLKATCSFDVSEATVVYHSEISENISNSNHSSQDRGTHSDPHNNDEDDDMQAKSFMDNKNNVEPCFQIDTSTVEIQKDEQRVNDLNKNKKCSSKFSIDHDTKLPETESTLSKLDTYDVNGTLRRPNCLDVDVSTEEHEAMTNINDENTKMFTTLSEPGVDSVGSIISSHNLPPDLVTHNALQQNEHVVNKVTDYDERNRSEMIATSLVEDDTQEQDTDTNDIRNHEVAAENQENKKLIAFGINDIKPIAPKQQGNQPSNSKIGLEPDMLDIEENQSEINVPHQLQAHAESTNLAQDIKLLDKTELLVNTQFQNNHHLYEDGLNVPPENLKTLIQTSETSIELHQKIDFKIEDQISPACSLKELEMEIASNSEIRENDTYADDKHISLKILQLAENNVIDVDTTDDTCFSKEIDETLKLAENSIIGAKISDSHTRINKEQDESSKLAKNNIETEISDSDIYSNKAIDTTLKLAEKTIIDAEISEREHSISKEIYETLKLSKNNIIETEISGDTYTDKEFDITQIAENNISNSRISDSDTRMNKEIGESLKLAENNIIVTEFSDSDNYINKEIDITLKLDENNIINSEISDSDTSMSKEIDETLKLGDVIDVKISDSDSCRKKYTTNENGWSNNSEGIHINDDEILKEGQNSDVVINNNNKERNLKIVGHETNTKLFEINCDPQQQIDNTTDLNPRTNMKNAIVNFYINESTNLSDLNEDMRPLENLKSEIIQSKTPRCKKATNGHVLSKDLQITTKMINLQVDGSEDIGNKTRTVLKKGDIPYESYEYTARDTNSINENNETKIKPAHTVKYNNSIDGVSQNHRDFNESSEGIVANNETYLTKESIESEYADKVESGSSNDNKLQKNVTLVYKGDSNVILKGSIYEDPVVGICYVFPAINRTSSTDEINCSDVCDDKTIDAIKKINSNVFQDSNNLDFSEDVQIVETFNVVLPKVTYSRQRFKNNENINIDDKINRKNLKRKLSGYDNKFNAKRYRKGKNIDYPKFSAVTMLESAYSKEYKRLLDYCTSVKFSYSRCFHKEYIDVVDILKGWPIKDTDMNVPDNTDLENTLFSEEQFENKVRFDPLQQTLAEEISQCNENQYISCDINETNFNMGFGEGSDRVIQISEDGNDISKFSAATLSDVKQSQPCLTSEEYGNCNKNQMLCTSHKHQIEILKRSISYIKLRDKVRSFFKKTTAELNYHWLMDTMKSKYKNSYNNSILLSGFPYDLISSDFIEPPPVEAVVQVVQVGQLPVSAAAQNPVTCDPRVTQVTDASPQCSIENSPHDDSQSPIKTEYTELTTADLSLPLVHDYNRHMESQESSKMSNSHHEDIPVETEITSIVKTEITVELSPLKEEPIDYNDSDDLQSLVNKHINNVDYSFDSNDNSVLETQSNTDISYESLENHETDFSPQEKQNCSAEKTDQIAHAMNAAGITTTLETNINTRTHSLVNMLPLKNCQEAPAVTSAPSVNNYSKTPVNAMTLQQALAQILPPPLNQTNVHENSQTNTNSSVTSQVLHIVQGKNTNGNQITLVDNSQNSVISNTNTPVLHIVQNKGASTNSTPNANSGQHTNSYSGLSLVDAGIQQGSNQLLHIVNTGNQKNNSPGQLLKRVNLLTNLTNVQGSNEQKMVQFVCKSADGKSIHLNAPHQRSMVLRLQPIEPTNIQTNPKATECQDNTNSCPASNTNNATSNKESSNAQHEIKSRSVYEENYAKFIQNSSNKSVEKSTSLPKFGQAFGKQVFQDGNQKGNDINANNSSLSSINSNSESSECQANDNSVNLDHIGQINSPPLLLRKSPSQPAQSQSSQANLVQQIKQTIAPMNIQTMHGGVIYTRQIPVNIGGGQTINLITVPSTELIDEANQKQKGDVKFVNQNEIDSPIIKIVPQNQSTANAEGSHDDTNNHSGLPNENAQNTPAQHQTVLTQMRIKLPMLSKTPQMVSGARVVRPSFFQIQRNVIGGANQHVYQQLVLTAAPPLGQHTIRLPQAQANRQTTKTTADGQATSEPQMSSSTLEQLREFDMVLEQVKERSTVQPNSNSNSTFTKMLTPTTETSEGTSVTSTVTESTQQVLYSIGSNQSLNVAYINRKTVATTPTTSTFVRSPDSTGIIDTPSSSHVQIPHTVTSESTLNEASSQPNQPKPAKVGSKSKSRPKSSSNPPNSLKINTLPPKPTQKPLEDEQTTQRILYILAEYKEQVENSPDKDKPAPRRRSNPPTTSSGSSKRKKSSSGSRRPGARDMSPVHGEDTCRTMGSEDSSCGTSQGDCNESCLDSHSPQDSPRKVVRKLTFENETSPVAQPRPQPQRNVIVADGQTITVARGTTGKPATAVLMPANYILPVSMVKGGQQIAIVTNRGPKLLTVGGGEGGATNALLLQRLIGPAGLKPVLTRPGVRHVRLPTAALHNLQAFNLTAATTAPPPDSTASPAPAPTPPELIETRANSSPWTDRESQDVKPERESSPEGSEPWNLPSSADPHDYTYEETVRTDNMDRTVLESIPDRYSPDMEAQRIFDKMFDVESKKSYIDSHDDSSRCAYDIDASDCDDKVYHQVVHKKDGASQRHHRLTHVSAAALRHKYAILEHELRLQKSLSEECEDLGVGSPSASELFPEAELLFAASPAHDAPHHSHTPQPTILNQSGIPQPDIDDQIATDELLQQEVHEDQQELDVSTLGLDEGIVTVSEDGMQATIALDQEEFARSHPNTTFHSEPTDEGEVQPFTIAGLKGRHITSTIFHAGRAPATVLVTAPQTTVISQANSDHAMPNNVKYANMDQIINSSPVTHGNLNLSSVLVKDDGLTKFDNILTDSRELHLSNTASAIVHSTGNATQVIRRVCYEDDKRDTRFLMDEPDALIAGDDAKMIAEDSSRDATLESIAGDVDDDNSSPERHAELFWESNSASERSESRRPMDFSSDSEKCCKSPSYDETNSTDSSGVGTHMRLDSVIKDARGIERSGSADGSSADDTHPPLRTYPAKRMYHALDGEVERSMSGKTRAGERSPDSLEVRRRASGRGVVKRGCHCCTGSPAPPRPKKSRQRKPAMDFTN